MLTFDVLAILVMAAIVLGLQRAGGPAMNYRSVRVLTCPATHQSAAVQLDAWRGAIGWVFGRPALRIHRCSEWPSQRGCDQACLRDIAATPPESLVANILFRWYQNRSCVCCGTPFKETRIGRHPPCLMSPEGKMIEWRDIPPQNIPGVLASASPVCWTCLMAETHTW